MDRTLIVSIGEILVEFVSHKIGCGLSSVSEYSGPYPSGAPAIFVDQAARMGARCEMIGGVGEDGFGHAVLARLKQDGVGVNGITMNRNHTTGVAFVSYYENGTRDFIFHLTNTAAEQFALPDRSQADRETFLHVSAASLGNASMRGNIMDVVRRVHDAGGRISCDPNARPELMQNAAVRTALDTVMGCSTCLMPSTSDLGFLFPGASEEDAINHLLNAKAEIIVIKRGAAGATILGGGERHDFAGHGVTEIDPTGAGDCFGGTFIGLLAQGASLHTAGEHANAAGAIAVTRRGPMEGNSTPAEIAAFLKQHKSETAT